MPSSGLRALANIVHLESTPLARHDLPESTYAALQRSARRSPEAPALSFFFDAEHYQQAWHWSYAELFAAITRTANAFHTLGVGPGDVVAFVLPNLPETHFCTWGGEAAGIVMPINPLLDGAQIAELLRAANASVLVTLAPTPGQDTWERIAPQLERLPAIRELVWVSSAPYLDARSGHAARACADEERQRFPQRRIHDLHELLAAQPDDRLASGRTIRATDHSSYFCTGGTTGLPKIAVRTQGAEVFDAWAFGAMLGGDPTSERYFCGLPLFHVNAQLVTGLRPWLQGGHVILGTPQGYRSPGLIQRFWQIVEHYRISFFSGVPTVYAALLQQPVGAADISSLNYALCGAAPMPVELFRDFERVSGVRILEGYGLTEGTCVSSCNPVSGDRRIGSIGLRLPYQPMRAVILDDDGRYLRDADIDEVGVVVLRGPNLFAGYLDESHNRTAWIGIDGQRWLNSGDLGRQDADGYFWLTGRKKELIIRGGHNIDPKQIEEALQAHPAVALVAAVGSPDAYAGEVPVAYVQLVKGAEVGSDELLEFAARHVAERAAVPKRIEILAALPVTPVGKLFKPALQLLEIERVVRQEARQAGHEIDVEVVQDSRRGPVARLRGPDRHSMAETLGRYAFQVECQP
ncbi:Long-chain-fatty-acid--CoA ligase [compost metagenome]